MNSFFNIILIFAFTLNNTQSLLKEQTITNPFISDVLLEVPINFLIAPLFYLFIIHFLNLKLILKKILFYSTIMFSANVVFRTYLLYLYKPSIPLESYHRFLNNYNKLEDVLIFIYTMVLFLITYVVFKKNIDAFEKKQGLNNLKWLKYFFIFLTFILSLWLITILSNYLLPHFNSVTLYKPLRLLISVLIYWLGYQGYQQNILLKERLKLREELKTENVNFSKTIKKKTALNNKNLDLFNVIDYNITANKLFLDSNLKITTIAQNFNLSEKKLSKLIYTVKKRNFNDYINFYRVEYAKKLLTNS